MNESISDISGFRPTLPQVYEYRSMQVDDVITILEALVGHGYFHSAKVLLDESGAEKLIRFLPKASPLMEAMDRWAGTSADRNVPHLPPSLSAENNHKPRSLSPQQITPPAKRHRQEHPNSVKSIPETPAGMAAYAVRPVKPVSRYVPDFRSRSRNVASESEEDVPLMIDDSDDSTASPAPRYRSKRRANERDADYIEAREAVAEEQDRDGDYDDDANHSLRARMNAYITRMNTTKAAMSRRLSIDRSVLSRWLNGGRSTNDTVARLVGAFLRTVDKHSPATDHATSHEASPRKISPPSDKVQLAADLPPLETIRRRLRSFMQREQLSQDDVGKVVHVERSSISRWLHGRSASEQLTRAIWEMLQRDRAHNMDTDREDSSSDDDSDAPMPRRPSIATSSMQGYSRRRLEMQPVKREARTEDVIDGAEAIMALMPTYRQESRFMN